MFEGIPLHNDPLGHDWLIMVIVAAAMLFTVTLTHNRLCLKNISSLFIFRRSSRTTDDPRQVYRWEMTVTNLASIISIALFLYIVIASDIARITIRAEALSLFLMILALTSVSLSVRHVITMFIRRITRNTTIFGEYIVTIHTVWQLTGMVLLPISVTTLYLSNPPASALISTGIIFVILLYFLRLIRLMTNFTGRRVSIIYFILYICALELLPVAILYRVLASPQ